MRCFLVLFAAQALLAQQPAFNLSALDPILERTLSLFTPGASLLITVEGQTVYRKTAGIFDTAKPVPIASASKWLAAATILTLVDDRTLSLDTRVSQYLPQFNQDKAAITLRQLLSHTSGLVSDSPCLVSGSTAMAGCVSEIAAEPLRFPPGAKFAYGNASLQVAGHLAERATGKSWNTLFWERLGTPLKFACTRLDGIGSLESPIVANGVVSCADDYTRFLQMIIGGGVYGGRRILSTASIAEMSADQTRGVEIAETLYSSFAQLDPQLPLLRYGLGVWRERVDPSFRALEISSQGAFGFSPWVDFQRNLTGVLAVESSQEAIMQAYLDMKAVVRRTVPAWPDRAMLTANGASFAIEPVAPGAIFSLFGPAIGPASERTLRLDSATQVSTQLDGLRVLVGDRPAPLIYAGWGQISAVIPFEMEGRQSAVVQLEQNGVRGPLTLIAIATASPGIFTLTSNGRGQAAALNQDGSVNGPARPAVRGSILILYATGLGPLQPPVPTGSVPFNAAISRLPVQVLIGGQQAEVLYAGVAPGSIAGVYQINARIPQAAPAGAEIPIVLQAAAASSSALVTAAIR
jgi:uncharacterized protein (TIGR03437 family)